MTDIDTEAPAEPQTGTIPWPSGDFRTPEQEMAEKGAGVPDAHELDLADINPLNAHLFAEDRWHGHFERLRNEDPVHFNEIETAGRYWSVTTPADIKAVEADWETFSSAAGITLGPKVTDGPAMPNAIRSFIAMDPPEQRQQRLTVTPAVRPQSLQNFEELIRERTVEVLESLPEGETFDWVDTVSVELTTRMLATLFDFPFEDRRMLTRWSDLVFAIPAPGGLVESHAERRDGFIECVQYFSRLWEERREHPGHDLVSMLAHGEATKHLSAAEQLGNLLLLIVGGNDTTRNTMSGSVYGLNTYPEQYDKLVSDPGLIHNMVQEIIRWQTPLAYMRRTATRDCELGGKQIREGDQVLNWYISANRDPSLFEDADHIDIERANVDQHLSFGYGIHRCMGLRLAEMQLRVLWEEVLARFERVDVQAEPTRTLSSFVHGYTNLPVQITRR